MESIAGGVCAATGFLAAGVRAGIKTDGLDVALIASERPCAAAGVFTRNAFISPCARISRERIRAGLPVRGVFANSGCANACTGPAGEADIVAIMDRTGEAIAERLPGVEGTILACQTGVIGKRLTPDRVEGAIVAAASGLSRDGAADAARAIMTTDTVPKECAVEFPVGGRTVRVGGMAKGAGMIAPNMGTMHVFITTDIAAEPGALQNALAAAVDETFNCITVDGDTSTSDAVLLLANGASGVPLDGASREAFTEALRAVCHHLSQAIVRDGEGATKLVEIRVEGARTTEDARRAARTIAYSLLTKTAMFGGDPNWGRILAALGRSGAEVDPDRVVLDLGGLVLFRSGSAEAYDLKSAEAAVAGPQIAVHIDLGLGAGRATVWTCYLSYDYVRINAEYHT